MQQASSVTSVYNEDSVSGVLIKITTRKITEPEKIVKMTDWEVVIELSDSDSESESDDSVIELSSDSDSEECTGGECM